MDTTHQKFTNTTNWEQYNMSMDNHLLDHHHQQITPFDHTQWSNYPLVHQNPNEPSNSSPTQLLGSIGSTEQAGTFKFGDQEEVEEQEEELGAMKEMMFKIASMQPIDIDPATVRKPKRRNVRISDDPQSVAARHRRERISEKMRILQRLVPGGTKMDTASMLDEAVCYVKFLKRQIRTLQANPYPPQSAPIEDWVGIGGTSYMLGGNGINDVANHDNPTCFNV